MIRATLPLGTSDTSSWAASPSQEAFLKKGQLGRSKDEERLFLAP
jgi:hypothetical protein